MMAEKLILAEVQALRDKILQLPDTDFMPTESASVQTIREKCDSMLQTNKHEFATLGELRTYMQVETKRVGAGKNEIAPESDHRTDRFCVASYLAYYITKLNNADKDKSKDMVKGILMLFGYESDLDANLSHALDICNKANGISTASKESPISAITAITDTNNRAERIATPTKASDVLPKQKQQIKKKVEAPTVTKPVTEIPPTASATPLQSDTETPRHLSAFKIEDALGMPPIEWIVDNFIAEHSITVVYAEPKMSKSYICGNMALSVALGLDWLGMSTIKSPVLWVDLDMGHYGAMKRMVEIASGITDNITNTEFANLHIITPETFKLYGMQKFDFFSGTSVEELKEYIIANDIKLCVIDTLSQIRGISNENDAGDMTKVFETVKNIRDITGCAFVIIHHATKPSQYGKQTARGSSVIYAEPDLIINITKDSENKIDNTMLTMVLESARYIEPRKIGLYQSWQPRFDSNDQPIKENGKQLSFYKLEVRDLKEEQKASVFEQCSKLLSYIRKHPGSSFNQIFKAKDETGISNRNKLASLLKELTPMYIVAEDGKHGATLYSIAEPSE